MITNQVEAYASEVLLKLPQVFTYHNIDHTRKVVSAVKEIGHYSKLSNDELETVLIAAWMHDTGYVNGIENHEDHSALLAETLLKSLNTSAKKISTIKNVIAATRMPQQPLSLIEEVICDADLAHLADDEFINGSEKLREEWRLTHNKIYTDKEWAMNNLSFLKSHKYFTSYGKRVLQDGKDRNILLVKRILGN
jgi:predicted metal-dependent HD superfamily phosphohydrolase